MLGCAVVEGDGRDRLPTPCPRDRNAPSLLAFWGDVFMGSEGRPRGGGVNRRERRELVRREGRRERAGRREALAAAGELGATLLAIREQRRYVSEGFETFEGFCAARGAALCPAIWQFSPHEAEEFLGFALKLAEERQLGAGRR